MADEGAQKKSSKLKWVLLILLLFLIVGGGAAAWYFFLQDRLAPPNVERREAQPVNQPAARIGPTVALDQFTTNLADPLGQRFIRMNISVEVADSRVANELAQQNPRIRDSVLMLLASKSYADIATTEGRMMLRSEITDRLNAILGPGKVHQIFITDMVVQ